MDKYSYPEELYHYGVLGMKWGKRKYQNADGSLTPAGKRRIKEDRTFKSNKEYRKEMRDEERRLDSEYDKKYGVSKARAEAQKFGDADDYDYTNPKANKAWDKYAKLSSKKYKSVQADMKQKYGEDYDKLKQHDMAVGLAAATTAVGMVVASTVLVSKGAKVLASKGADVLVSKGKKVLGKLISG